MNLWCSRFCSIRFILLGWADIFTNRKLISLTNFLLVFFITDLFLRRSEFYFQTNLSILKIFNGSQHNLWIISQKIRIMIVQLNFGTIFKPIKVLMNFTKRKMIQNILQNIPSLIKPMHPEILFPKSLHLSCPRSSKN